MEHTATIEPAAGVVRVAEPHALEAPAERAWIPGVLLASIVVAQLAWLGLIAVLAVRLL